MLWLSLMVSSSLYYSELGSSYCQEKLAPLVSSDYDLKVTALINESLVNEISNKSFVDEVVFVLVADLNLNNHRVTGILISDLNKLNMTNYIPKLIEGGNGAGVIISKNLATELNLKVGDTVLLRPLHGNQNVELLVAGIAEFPFTTDADIILKYPEEFKEYYSNRLPTHALFGEAYVKLKTPLNKSDEYIKTISSAAVDIYYRSERLKELQAKIDEMKHNTFYVLSKFSGIFAAVIVVLTELNFFMFNIKKFRFNIPLKYLGAQFMLYISSALFMSSIMSLAIIKLIFGHISLESILMLITILSLALATSYVAVHLTTKRGECL